MRTRRVLAFVFAVFTMVLGPSLPIAAADQAIQPAEGMELGQSRSIASDVMRAAPEDLLDDIFSFDADSNTASWLGLDMRNISVSETPARRGEPYRVTLDADLFDADEAVATLTSRNTLDRMAISITTNDAVFDQTVERYDKAHLVVTSTLTPADPGDTRTESSVTLTEIVDINTGEITVQGRQGRASQDEFWEAVAGTIGFPGLDDGGRSVLGWLTAGLILAAVVVAIICVVGTVLNPWGWCW